MKEKLVIVESPSKARTISSYLGDEYEVLSSVGHIRDLATSGPGGLGLDIENDFKPTYTIIRGKNKVVNDLKKAAKNREVLIATDPDREGEAIAWHIADELKIDTNLQNRIIFTEITKNSILEALNNPKTIDHNLVNSQEVRRAIDRIIGFRLSNLMRSKIGSASAGRVQSVALKLIVDLEKEIRAFVPEEYYEIEADLKDFVAEYVIPANTRIKKEEAEEIVKTSTNPFVVSDVRVREQKRRPRRAFTTSTMQQDANLYLRMSSARTMALAQQLYEGIEIDGELTGLITYMRTDSTRMSNEFVGSAINYIKDEFGDNYVGKYTFSKKAGSQDAHEAIRPTSIYNTPEKMKKHLDEHQLRLYERIYNRAVSSLMADAIFERTRVTFDANGNLYRINGVKEIFKGFLRLYDEQQTKDVILPDLKLGDKLEAKKVEMIRKETKPKARYNEALLIKEMESLGIGRPSTYASTINTLKDKNRNYLTIESRRFIPTDHGILTSEKLDEFFNEIINVNYTKEMEEQLDLIADGKEHDVDLLKNFYNSFIPLIDNAYEKMEKPKPKETDKVCPECGSPLLIRKSRFGEFYGCSNFPKCRYTENMEENTEKEA